MVTEAATARRARAAVADRWAGPASGGAGGGSGAGSGNGNGSGGGALVAVAGTYDVTTKFDLLDALPPDVKTALDLVLELGDSPGSFLLDMADKLPVIKYVIDAINLFSGVRDQIVSAIDEYINRWSGGMVTVMHKLSSDLEMALRGLSTHNRLVVGTPDATGKVSIDDTLLDLTFTWNSKPYTYAQNAHATFSATVTGLQIMLPAHGYDRGLDFGGVLVDLIDNVALPQLTGVSSLGALANQLVECGGVADWVWGYIGNTHIGNTYLSSYISIERHRQAVHQRAQRGRRRRREQAVVAVGAGQAQRRRRKLPGGREHGAHRQRRYAVERRLGADAAGGQHEPDAARHLHRHAPLARSTASEASSARACRARAR